MANTPVWVMAYGGPYPGATPMFLTSAPGATPIQIVGYEPPWNGSVPSGVTPIWVSTPQASGAVAANVVAVGGTWSAAAPATSTWSSADASANAMTLSNGGMMVTPSGAAPFASIRGSISKSTGKLYVEFSNSAVTSGGISVMFGVASSGFNAASYLGASNYSAGSWPSSPTSNVSPGFTPNYAITQHNPQQNDVWALAVDFTAGNIWLAQNNVWLNSSNPGTGSLPYFSFVQATVGALFPTLSFSSTGCGVWTLQPTPASQKYLPPVGYQAWDGGPIAVAATTLDPAHTYNGTLSNGNLKIAATAANGAAASTTTRSTGKWHVEFTLNVGNGIENVAVGFSTSNGPPGSGGIGTSASSIGLWGGTATKAGYYTNSAFLIEYTVGFVAGDTVALEIDLDAQLIWWRNSNTSQWNQNATANPATGTGGVSLSTMPKGSPYYFIANVYQNIAVETVNFGATTFAVTPSPGFTAWG